ncbi:MAG: 50S ribosomal protein L18 [Candidatus Cyclobacteriaceae bacterium M2_1C_046]
MALDKLRRRNRIRNRVRSKIQGTTERPRLSVFKSNKAIYAQIIDDLKGHTITAASSIETGKDSATIESAKEVGKKIAEKAKAEGIESIVFDRSGYIYHGKVKALADGAREGGLKF